MHLDALVRTVSAIDRSRPRGTGEQGVLFAVPAAAPASAPPVSLTGQLPALPGGDAPNPAMAGPGVARTGLQSQPAAHAVLWLAVALPDLPLLAASGAAVPASAADSVPARTIPAATALADQQTTAMPTVLVEGQGTGQRVWRMNAAAEAAGIRGGMPIGAAASLLPANRKLVLLTRDPAAEARLLQRLTWLALCFSSRVAISAPDVLLIEAAGSLRLFGGLESLCEAVRAAFMERLPGEARAPALAVAPFPAAAELLARRGHEGSLRTAEATRAALAPLPMAALPLTSREQSDLIRLGIGSIGECLRLPREGLARRLSPQLVQQLDRLCGRAPDPRETVRPPMRFSTVHSFPLPTTDFGHLQQAADRLLITLNDYLTARCGQVQHLVWHLGCRQAGRIEVVQGLARPGRPGPDERRRWCEMFVERLAKTGVSAPVEWLALSVRRVLVSAGQTPALIETDESRLARREHAWQALLTRLAARLGPAALRQVVPRPDHRPEAASCYRPADEISGPTACGMAGGGPRPLLLRQPVTILPTDSQHRPLWGGALKLLTPRERIEAGWWEGEDSSRDYYVARNAAGEQAWLCRVLPRGGAGGYWCLQGTFE